MKVIILNGSPHAGGNTYRALGEVTAALEEDGITAEFVQLGKAAIPGCTACNYCTTHGACVFHDIVNELAAKLASADGLIVGTPVHYAGAAGALISALDRLFYSAPRETFRMKPAAAVAIARRGGASAALDQLSKYFSWGEMPQVSSTYWNLAYGTKPLDVEKDAEGLQTMRQLGHNMAWMLHAFNTYKTAGHELPVRESGNHTNFIR